MLSKRLKMVADMVEPCDLLADIGTDHGYLPIHLVKNKIVRHIIAADISQGSCQKASFNISLNKLNESIEIRCGDGLTVIKENEQPDTITISGMGGMLAINVLKSNPCGLKAKRLVLQVQRDICTLRQFLHSSGYIIVCEDMIKEDGKYYTSIAAIKGCEKPYSMLEYNFGKLLLESKNQILKEYIIFENNKIEKVIDSLMLSDDEKIMKRVDELRKLSNLQKEALKCL